MIPWFLISLSMCQVWKFNCKGTAVFITFNRDRTAMIDCGVFDDRKTQARSSKFLGSGLIDPIEALKYPVLSIRWYADAVIFNFDDSAFGTLFDSDFNISVFTSVFDRIID